MNIPLVDLKAQYQSIKPEIDKAIKEVLNSTKFIDTSYPSKFEKEFAEFNKARHAIGLNSGTDALFLSLKAMNIKPRDEIVTVPNTFIATTAAITQNNANIKFVDINKDTYNIDINLIEKAITQKTKAILPVHLYGQMADMNSIKEIADKHNLIILEDATQSHNAEFNNKKPGNYSNVTTFSFYPGKNLGAYGDAGAITTNNDKIKEKIILLRNHGRISEYKHTIEGFNSRLDNIQAAILSVKLKHLKNWTSLRREKAKIYNELLENVDITTPFEHEKAKHVYYLYVIRTQKRDQLQKFLKQNGISTNIHYPIPLHLQPAYKHLNYKQGDFPITEKYSKEILSLPIYPEITQEQISYICNKIKEFKKL